MLSNARQIQDTYGRINKQVKDAIFDMDNRKLQLQALANDFTVAMTTVQDEANFLSKIDDNISSMERELEIVQIVVVRCKKD